MTSHALIVFIAVSAGCEHDHITYQQGNCRPGQVQSGNTCIQVTGTPCGQDGSCLAGQCVVDGDNQYCTTLCETDTDCPLAFICSPAGGSKYCQKDPQLLPGRCRTTEDCGICAVCSYGACRASLICLQVLCRTDVDCGVCRRCNTGVCELVDNCGPACNSNADCGPGERCTFDYQGGLACLPIEPGTFGTPCTNAGGAQCESGVCLYGEGVSPYYGTYCSIYCSPLSGCPPGYVCGRYPPLGGAHSYCMREDEKYFPASCRGPQECVGRDPGLVCRYGLTPDGTSMVAYCGTPPANGQHTGERCISDIACKTGVCPESGRCTNPCEPDGESHASADCTESFFCLPQTKSTPQGDISFYGCQTYTALKGRIGDICPSGNGDCESGLCITDVPRGAQPYCSKPCSSPLDCDGVRYFCLPTADGGSACQYQEGGKQLLCRSDSDCETGVTACARVFGTDSDGGSTPNSIECTAYGPSQGGVGDPCSFDADCRSLICLPDGRCSAMCRNPDDCPSDYSCDFSWISDRMGGIVTYRNCKPLYGSEIPCARSSDCATGEVCRATYSYLTNEIMPICRLPYQNWLPDGSACTSNLECASGLCLGLGACAPMCRNSGDCLEDVEECAPVAYVMSDQAAKPVNACRPKRVDGGTGSQCRFDDQCFSQTCYQGQDRSFCTERCMGNGECLGSYTVCRYEEGYGYGYICTPADYRPTW